MTGELEEVHIRPACLRPADAEWQEPSGVEIREILRRAGLSGSAAAQALGLGKGGDRTVRRWISRDTLIPYAAWAILCDLAGERSIWRVKD